MRFSSDEAECGIRYRASADWPTLGKKLRKDLNRVKTGLTSVTSDQVKRYSETGALDIDGIQLVAGDLLVTRYVELPSDSHFGTNADGDAVVLLDIHVYPELLGEWFARELVNRVQKLRKKAELQATEDVGVYYLAEEGQADALHEACDNQRELLTRSLRCLPAPLPSTENVGKALIEEDQEIAETKFKLVIVRK